METAETNPEVVTLEEGNLPPGFPLSATLTVRVITYLNIYRLIISLAMIGAFAGGIFIDRLVPSNPSLTYTGLGAYLALAIGLLASTRSKSLSCFTLAQTSLLIDILFLSIFYTVFGGGDSGLGVLLIFTSAAAAILLPLRMALFLASLASIVIIGDAFTKVVWTGDRTSDLLGAGIYGMTNLVTAVLVHLLAVWARDYRLIAERQQRHLLRLEQINELIIRRMRGGVLAVDQQGEIRLMNESAWFLLGSPSSSDRVLAEVSPELHRAMEAWRRSPRNDPEPLTLNASQAQVMPKFVTLPGHHDVRVLIFLEDNDVVAQRALELSTNSLAKLSGSIAHEIRNPLAAASHAAQLLAESEELDESNRRLVSIITKHARRMNDIIENILQLSRREKSRPDLFDLGPWLEELAEEFRTAESRRIPHLELAVEDGVTLVMFDRSQLHQAIWKLLENAADHGGRDGQPVQVMLRLVRHRDAGYCVVSVENDGEGIPEQHLENIFEPFYTTRTKGSGLGLYVARQLCEANQAEITVDSTPGWKTRFHIRMSLAANDADAVNPEPMAARL